MKGHGHELLGCTWLYRRLFLPPVSAPPTAPHNVLIFGADGRNGHMVDRAVWTGGASLGIHRCPRWMGRVVYVSTLPRCSFGDRALLRDQHGTRGRGMAVGVLHLYLQKRKQRRKRPAQSTGRRVQQWWDVLGVNPSASADAIKAAYHRVAKVTHPDSAPDGKGDVERFRRANEASQEGLKRNGK